MISFQKIWQRHSQIHIWKSRVKGCTKIIYVYVDGIRKHSKAVIKGHVHMHMSFGNTKELYTLIIYIYIGMWDLDTELSYAHWSYMYWHMRFEYTTGLYTLIIYIYRHMRYGNITRLCTVTIYIDIWDMETQLGYAHWSYMY